MVPYQDVEPFLPSELHTSQPCTIHDKKEEALEANQNNEGQLKAVANVIHRKGLGCRYCHCPPEPKEESKTDTQDDLLLRAKLELNIPRLLGNLSLLASERVNDHKEQGNIEQVDQRKRQDVASVELPANWTATASKEN